MECGRYFLSVYLREKGWSFFFLLFLFYSFFFFGSKYKVILEKINPVAVLAFRSRADAAEDPGGEHDYQGDRGALPQQTPGMSN